jgi:hypothetical protein
MPNQSVYNMMGFCGKRHQRYAHFYYHLDTVHPGFSRPIQDAHTQKPFFLRALFPLFCVALFGGGNRLIFQENLDARQHLDPILRWSMWKRNQNRLGSGLWPWLLALASVGTLDWFLTWLLVERRHAVEANPIAAKVLQQFGWWGLAYFKASSVILVAVLGHVIARKNRWAAQRLLQFACACTLLIVGYSFFQVIRQEIACASILERENRRLAMLLQQRQRFTKYVEKVHELSRQLVDENRPLSQAVQELVQFLAQTDPLPMGVLGLAEAGPNLEKRLAAHLVSQAGYLVKNQPEPALRLLSRLQKEFASSFSSPRLPTMALAWFPKPENGH